jgi:stalled ribosome rescue protein Dom34
VNHYHVCVWIDHYEAKIFGVDANTSEDTVIEDKGPHHHIHRKADHVHLGTDPVDGEFLDEVAGALKTAKAILICGPGKAHFELAGYLNDRYPASAKHIWGIERMDHPTGPQIVAKARAFFRAGNRMHA